MAAVVVELVVYLEMKMRLKNKEENLAKLRLDIAVRSAQNEFQARYVELEHWYNAQKEAYGESELLEQDYALRKQAIRDDLITHNVDAILAMRDLNNERLVDEYQKEQEAVQAKKELWTSYAYEVAATMAGPMEFYFSELMYGIKSSKDMWKEFVQFAQDEANRFLAQKAVQVLLNFAAPHLGTAASAVWSFASSKFGGSPKGLASGGYVPAKPGGTLALIGEGGQDEIVLPVNKIADFNSGQYSLPVIGGGGSATYNNQRYDNSKIVNNYSSPTQFLGTVVGQSSILDIVEQAKQRKDGRLGNNLNKGAF